MPGKKTKQKQKNGPLLLLKKKKLVSVSTDYTHASWQLESWSGLSGFGCFGQQQKK